MNMFFGNKEYTIDKEELKIDLRNLHKCVKESNVKKVKKLLSSKKGKHILNVADELDQTAIMIAARCNNIEMFELVLSFYKICKIDINVPDKNGYTALHHFFSMPDLEAKLLLILLEHDDIAVNITNRDLNTPFHYFVQKFRSNSSVKEVFDRLVSKGANVNAINRNGESPLHKAIFNTTLAQTMVSLLLSNQAHVNVTNKNGESCLHYCVRMGRTDLVQMLLNSGADRSITKDNKSLYDIAIEENFTKLADLLKEGGSVLQSNGTGTELITLLQNPTLREDFRAFLRDELICEENISFWQDIEAYKHLKVDSPCRLFKEFYKIYDKYIADNSACEINVPYSIKKEINGILKTLPSPSEVSETLANSNNSASSSPSLPPSSSNSPKSMSPSPSTNTLLLSQSTSTNSISSMVATSSVDDLNTINTIDTILNDPTATTTANITATLNSLIITPPSSPTVIAITNTTTDNNNNNNNNNNSSTNTTPTNTTTSFSISASSTPPQECVSPPVSQPSSPSTSCSSLLGVPTTPPAYDVQKVQTIYNLAQQHIFMLMATDSLSKYKKRSRKSKSYLA
eukprot:gene4023-4659_t